MAKNDKIDDKKTTSERQPLIRSLGESEANNGLLRESLIDDQLLKEFLPEWFNDHTPNSHDNDKFKTTSDKD